jgi:hypothetical protein
MERRVVAYPITAAPFNRKDVPRNAVNKRKKKKAPKFGASAVAMLVRTKPTPVMREI